MSGTFSAMRIVTMLPEPVRSRLRGLVRGAPSHGDEASGQTPPDAAPPEDDRVTTGDIHAAYRLFHGRAADPEGLAFFSAHVGEWSVTEMLPYFAHSAEFRSSATFRALIGGVDGGGVIEIDRGDHRLLVPAGDDAIGGVLTRTGEYEPHVMSALDRLLTPGSTFVDCGANIGILTFAAAAKVGGDGRVIAVEALADNVDILRLTRALNGFDRVEVVHAAVADRATTLVVDNAAGSNGIIAGDLDDLITRVPADSLAARQIVETVRLDDLIDDDSTVDVLKLDIEGAEGRALTGAKRILETFRPAVLLEYSPVLLRKVSDVEGATLLAELARNGYSIEILDPLHADVGVSPARVDEVLAQTGGDHLDLLLEPS